MWTSETNDLPLNPPVVGRLPVYGIVCRSKRGRRPFHHALHAIRFILPFGPDQRKSAKLACQIVLRIAREIKDQSCAILRLSNGMPTAADRTCSAKKLDLMS